MEKFKEMRLRAFAFQELTGCNLYVGKDGIITLRADGDLFAFRDNGFYFYLANSSEKIEVNELKWIAEIEFSFGAKFHTLAEAQEMINKAHGTLAGQVRMEVKFDAEKLKEFILKLDHEVSLGELIDSELLTFEGNKETEAQGES